MLRAQRLPQSGEAQQHIVTGFQLLSVYFMLARLAMAGYLSLIGFRCDTMRSMQAMR